MITKNFDIVKRLEKMVHIAEKKPGHGKHKLYAEIWRFVGNPMTYERVSCGWNHSGTSDLSNAYSRHDKTEGTCAECAAVISALSRYKTIAGSIVLVARAKRERRGGPVVRGLAKPCEGCSRLLYDFQVAAVWYTLDHSPFRPSAQYDTHELWRMR